LFLFLDNEDGLDEEAGGENDSLTGNETDGSNYLDKVAG